MSSQTLIREERERHVSVPESRLPPGVVGGSYNASIPLIRPSRLTSRQKGGVGKQLSDGWCLNFAVGCTHGCDFCYVDEIHKRFGRKRYGAAVAERWGDYLLIPSNLQEAIAKTPWSRWRNVEVMMSSTHDPYLPPLAEWARRILEAALPEGVQFCIQTRSFLVSKDLDLLARFKHQVRLQVSLATLDRDFARQIEKRVSPPESRLEVLRRAKKSGLDVGVILAPIFPACKARPDAEGDLRELIRAIAEVRPDHIYGESLHIRGQKISLIEEDLREEVRVTRGFDRGIAKTFRDELNKLGLDGTWWYEH